MNPDLQRAIAEFAHDNGVVMLVADPTHPDAFEAASFLFGPAADQFLDTEAIKATATKELDRLFVFIGMPFERLLMTRAGKPEEAKTWIGAMVEWYTRNKHSPALLAFVQDGSLRESISQIIADAEQEDRWAKFRV